MANPVHSNQSSGRLLKGLLVCFALLCIGFPRESCAAALKTQNVFLIMTDGFRWQEVFTGADEVLMTHEHGGVANVPVLRRKYWRDTPVARREVLLPFVWGQIGRNGQIFGNRTKGSLVNVTNGRNFSYPGYNEILTGAVDPRIDSNDKRPNPNMTVFEWLNGRPGLNGKVAVFATWDVFPYIFNVERSHLPIWPAWEPGMSRFEIPIPGYLAEIQRDTTELAANLTYDSFLFHAARDHITNKRPRLVFIGFGETDEWAHRGLYEPYLESAHRFDDFMRRLWEAAQSLPEYRDKTTFIVTSDHGRGTGPLNWRNHSDDTPGSEADWIAVIGPDTPALGERTNCAAITQNQIAATIAALMGEDYRATFPNAGQPVNAIPGGANREAPK